MHGLGSSTDIEKSWAVIGNSGSVPPDTLNWNLLVENPWDFFSQITNRPKESLNNLWDEFEQNPQGVFLNIWQNLEKILPKEDTDQYTLETNFELASLTILSSMSELKEWLLGASSLFKTELQAKLRLLRIQRAEKGDMDTARQVAQLEENLEKITWMGWDVFFSSVDSDLLKTYREFFKNSFWKEALDSLRTLCPKNSTLHEFMRKKIDHELFEYTLFNKIFP